MSAARELRIEPLLVSSGNCVAVIGQSWRWVRDHAASLGVPIHRVGGKPFIDAAAFREAVRRVPPEVVANDDGDELGRMRAGMGKRRAIAGGATSDHGGLGSFPVE